MLRKYGKRILPLLLAAALFFAGCGSAASGDAAASQGRRVSLSSEAASVSLSDIPEYSGEPSVVIHDNLPFFTEEEITTEVFEDYAELDELGRCGEAYANICRELMPTEERGDISAIHPTGWQSSWYEFVDGESLYNRCHLIAHELAGEDANEKNLITGTRFFNVDGMLPYENAVADYVYETDHHVLYRVTPLFDGDNLVADGVLMEAYSVEDSGKGICYCVFCYNVQPGIEIDYATGDNWLSDDWESVAAAAGVDVTEGDITAGTGTDVDNDTDTEGTYILNTNTMKFHLPDCSGAADISEKNREDYTGSRAALLEQGYSPCGICHP